MFVSRKKWDELSIKVARLEEEQNHIKGVVGTNTFDIYNRRLLRDLGFIPEEPEVQPLTLTQKVNQIMELLDIEEQHIKASARLRKKPVSKKEAKK